MLVVGQSPRGIRAAASFTDSRPDEPLPSYGLIASRLVQARELADSDLLLLHIDTALLLVRHARHSRALKVCDAGGIGSTIGIAG